LFGQLPWIRSWRNCNGAGKPSKTSSPDAPCRVHEKGGKNNSSRLGDTTLANCVDRTSQKVPNLRKKRIHPHSMRHSGGSAFEVGGGSVDDQPLSRTCQASHDESVRESGFRDETEGDRTGQTGSSPIAHTVEQRPHSSRLAGVSLITKNVELETPANRNLQGLVGPTPHFWKLHITLHRMSQLPE